MTNFEKAKFYYENKYTNEAGLQRWVGYGFISYAEYYSVTKDKLFLNRKL
ncbi:hypothetical protein [Desulfosporosinus nitroreducens]|uniref:Uncharacterized protein n=1 Tax=Desulfosporosinus nitroreducens TaxID=2018668 RepID=A0ABT8QRT2_9FIRM|nr:hypothetical protein [Desulfosporosinus nitroreducens]MDO0823577.1 hypothetical protein [Desulfosporosinus nitroreducens]